MKFWKKHRILRMILIAGLFVAGLALVLMGWSMTGELAGLWWMLAGIALMLISLLLYNKAHS